MKNLYIITGPAGVGKSSVSIKLAESLNKSALIEGDEIYHQVVSGYVSAWKDSNNLDVFFENCYDMIENYLNYGYDVVFNYILNKENIDDIKNKFKDINIKFICLMTDEDTLLIRDKQRPIDCRMNERCIILLNEFKNKKFNENNILDTSNINIDQTVNDILNNDRFIIK